jgi:hypothetical protein
MSCKVAGHGFAFGAPVFLVAPGLVAPPTPGTALMIVAGLCCAAYSLLGHPKPNQRRSARPGAV